uniref:Uncharacterized protein n=1 Tax=Anopheles atroparvus TaxID=41427 RepID=A0AAG5DEK6_ANOAO
MIGRILNFSGKKKENCFLGGARHLLRSVPQRASGWKKEVARSVKLSTTTGRDKCCENLPCK